MIYVATIINFNISSIIQDLLIIIINFIQDLLIRINIVLFFTYWANRCASISQLQKTYAGVFSGPSSTTRTRRPATSSTSRSSPSAEILCDPPFHGHGPLPHPAGDEPCCIWSPLHSANDELCWDQGSLWTAAHQFSYVISSLWTAADSVCARVINQRVHG